MTKIQPRLNGPKEYHDCIYRLEFTNSHKPLFLYTSKFDKQGDSYHIFVFRNHTVAESPQYGTVSFALKGTTGWQYIFSKSRQGLRKNYKDWVAWIRHPTTWE